jgi:hypothetical protein
MRTEAIVAVLAASAADEPSPVAPTSDRTDAGKDAERHTFRVEADTATVTFLVDGAQVAALDRADVAPDGRFGFRVGRAVDIHVVRLDYTRYLAPPRPPKAGAMAGLTSRRWSF